MSIWITSWTLTYAIGEKEHTQIYQVKGLEWGSLGGVDTKRWQTSEFDARLMMVQNFWKGEIGDSTWLQLRMAYSLWDSKNCRTCSWPIISLQPVHALHLKPTNSAFVSIGIWSFIDLLQTKLNWKELLKLQSYLYTSPTVNMLKSNFLKYSHILNEAMITFD